MLQQFAAHLGGFIQAMLLLWVWITLTCCGILALTSTTNWLAKKYGRSNA